MNDVKTTIRVASGVKSVFELELNKLSSDGYTLMGSLNTRFLDGLAFYSVLMQKTEVN
mgnify:FL=1